MKNKRFQECNWVEKLWRYRWYLLIPFQYIWYSYIKPMRVPETAYDDELCMTTTTGEEDLPKVKELWCILIGDSQIKMNWVWTSDEVFSRIKDKPKQK